MKERELPAGWEWKRLRDLFTLSSGKSRPDKIENTPTGTKIFPIYGGNGILGYSDKFFIQNPTIIIGRVGQYCGAVYISSENCWISDNALYADNLLLKKIDLTYLARALCKINLNLFKKKFGQPLITQKIVYDQYIPLPPLPIQRQIVTILEQAKAVKRQRQEADALTGALLQSVFYEMFGDPVRNEKGWVMKKLGDLCTIRRGASPRPIDDYLGGTVPWIKIGDGTKGNEIFIDNTSEKIIKAGVKKSVFLKKGSLIFANCGVSLGFARILNIDGCIHDGWLSLEDIDPSLNKIYLLKMINGISAHFRRIAPDGTQPNLNTGIMKNFLIPLPPFPLQQQFACVVQEVERIREQQAESKKEIDVLFEGLVAGAFAGELVA